MWEGFRIEDSAPAPVLLHAPSPEVVFVPVADENGDLTTLAHLVSHSEEALIVLLTGLSRNVDHGEVRSSRQLVRGPGLAGELAPKDDNGMACGQRRPNFLVNLEIEVEGSHRHGGHRPPSASARRLIPSSGSDIPNRIWHARVPPLASQVKTMTLPGTMQPTGEGARLDGAGTPEGGTACLGERELSVYLRSRCF